MAGSGRWGHRRVGRSTRFAVTTALVALVAAGGSAYAPTTDPVQQLRTDLDAILDQPGLADAHQSVLVQELDGTTLYARGRNERQMPASNAKLFTSAAALDVLGPDHRFHTTVLAEHKPQGGVLAGDLYLRGGGDPTILAEDYDDLAAQVAASGVDKVTGDLVADDTWFDDERLGASWASDDESYYYNAQISALTVAPDTDYDAGTVVLSVTPGEKVGDPADIEVVPDTSYVEIVNHTETTAKGERDTHAERVHGTNTIEVTGTVPRDAGRDKSWVTVWEPTGYAADVFRTALARHGVDVTGGTEFEAAPSSAREIAEHRSMPLRELLVPFMKLSNNGHAEVLVKEMGRQVAKDGSWDAGLPVMFDSLEKLGVERDRVRFVDGSGLSRMDVVSAQQIINLLTAAREQPWFRTWYAALPVAGVGERMVGGTLRYRMEGTAAAGNVRAKTGTLTGATGLSGYVTDADGKQLVFSILHNNHIGVNPKVMEDQIAIRLAEFTRDETAAPAEVRSGSRTGYGPADIECTWVKAC